MEEIVKMYRWLSETEAFGGVTYLQAFVGLVVVWAILTTARKIFGAKRNKQYMVRVICGSCGWEGQISRFTKYCPQCHADKVTLTGKR